MHTAAFNFVSRIKTEYPDLFRNKRVLEYGSYDVNGTIRVLFENCEYIGIDFRPGPHVDVVSMAHEYYPPWQADVVITMEMLEHDAMYTASLASMVGALKRGGSLIVTTASPHRPSHYMEGASSPGWYMGLAVSDIIDSIEDKFRISRYIVDDSPGINDLYGAFIDKK